MEFEDIETRLAALSGKDIPTERKERIRLALRERVARSNRPVQRCRSVKSIVGVWTAGLAAAVIALFVIPYLMGHTVRTKMAENVAPASSSEIPRKSGFTADPKILFSGLPMKTQIPRGWVGQQIRNSAGTMVRLYIAQNLRPKTTSGYIEIFFPASRMDKSTATSWVKAQFPAQATYKVHPGWVKELNSWYEGQYHPQPYTLNSIGVQYGIHNGNYFFVTYDYPSDWADQAVVVEQRLLDWWTWNDIGARLDASLPQPKGALNSP